LKVRQDRAILLRSTRDGTLLTELVTVRGRSATINGAPLTGLMDRDRGSSRCTFHRGARSIGICNYPRADARGYGSAAASGL